METPGMMPQDGKQPLTQGYAQPAPLYNGGQQPVYGQPPAGQGYPQVSAPAAQVQMVQPAAQVQMVQPGQYAAPVPQAIAQKKGCEEDDKCCLCLPIKCGMMTLGVFAWIDLIYYAYVAVVVGELLAGSNDGYYLWISVAF